MPSRKNTSSKSPSRGRSASKSRSPARTRSKSKSDSSKKSTRKASKAPVKKEGKMKSQTPKSKGKKKEKTSGPLLSSYFSFPVFANEFASCALLFFTFPVPALFSKSVVDHWVAEWLVHLSTVVLNDQLFAGFLSPSVIFALYLTRVLDRKTAVSAFAAQVAIAHVIYPLKTQVFHEDFIFGPICTSTMASCFGYELSTTFMLTLLCCITAASKLPSLAKSVLTGIWIRLMMVLSLSVSGSCMNIMIAYAYGLYHSHPIDFEHSVVYYMSAFIGAIGGVLASEKVNVVLFPPRKAGLKKKKD